MICGTGFGAFIDSALLLSIVTCEALTQFGFMKSICWWIIVAWETPVELQFAVKGVCNLGAHSSMLKRSGGHSQSPRSVVL